MRTLENMSLEDYQRLEEKAERAPKVQLAVKKLTDFLATPEGLEYALITHKAATQLTLDWWGAKWSAEQLAEHASAESRATVERLDTAVHLAKTEALRQLITDYLRGERP